MFGARVSGQDIACAPPNGGRELCMFDVREVYGILFSIQ